MITFWNKKEVFFGNSLQKFNETCEILAANKINYRYDLVNSFNGAGRDRIGSFGRNTENSALYYIYVHKKDYDEACAVMRNIRIIGKA